ncbi:ATP-binding protein cassette, sub-family E, member 1 [Trypanosoma conorhini]|uniref:ATP-binding protein cassette, sub-family E, member 1 n=1 Tax=Trypanosoma conorhini TaxID=83891 RepID=A0A3R7N7Q4_9TRYP|nr:ATP-binding protein cassette, sub-family E, member 1 [Trypanosoma conorhini]RNF17622.1 ATP-binding protein cassette, sub-family E, member 1 [Trypanosoma conorhini]
MKSGQLAKPITHDQVAELHELFRHFDGAGEGVLEMSRIKEFFFQMGPEFAEEVFVPVVLDANLDKVEEITFAQFFLIFLNISGRMPSNGNYELEQLKEVFAAFDPECTGYIEVNRFMQIMLEEGKPISSFEGKELLLQLRYFGCMRKGKVNYGKFLSRIFVSGTSNTLFAAT